MGYFYEEGQTRERQSGIVRTNCIDCLDRTNVVQGVLGRKHLESVLRRLQLLQPGNGLPEAFPGVRYVPLICNVLRLVAVHQVTCCLQLLQCGHARGIPRGRCCCLHLVTAPWANLNWTLGSSGTGSLPGGALRSQQCAACVLSQLCLPKGPCR